MSRFHSLGVLGTFSDWARRASSWSELTRPQSRDDPEPVAAAPSMGTPQGQGDLIYRLQHWPTLPSAMRTADVLRLLSLMSSRPVSRQWILTHGKLPARKLDALLQRLAAQGALQEINPASFPREPAGRR